MKTITNLKTTVEGNKVTITGEIIDRDFRMPAQQVTVPQNSPHNPRFIRHCQLSSEAFFIKFVGEAVAFILDELADVACEINPKLTWAPVLKQAADLTVEINSELEPTIQWQSSTDGKEWKDIAGATAAKLDRAIVPKEAKLVKAIAKSEAGQTETPQIQIAE